MWYVFMCVWYVLWEGVFVCVHAHVCVFVCVYLCMCSCMSAGALERGTDLLNPLTQELRDDVSHHCTRVLGSQLCRAVPGRTSVFDLVHLQSTVRQMGIPDRPHLPFFLNY